MFGKSKNYEFVERHKDSTGNTSLTKRSQQKWDFYRTIPYISYKH